MASNVAPPKNTGGGGFVFEDDVGAWLLVCMFVGEPVFGPALGAPNRIDFQTRPDGWFLDDVLITTAVGTRHHRFAFSVKSNAQFTASRAPADFVAVAWEQWLHLGSSVFDRARDFIGIITGPTSAAARTSISELLRKTRGADPALFPERIMTADWASEEERSLFASFACPPALAAAHAATDVDTVYLLQRLHVRQHDFGEEGSASMNAALQLCQRAVRSGALSEAENLWNALRSVAAELRPSAGHITRGALVDRLRNAFVLSDYPSYRADWKRLEEQSAGTAAQVPNAIAGRIALKRDASVSAVVDALEKKGCVAVVGGSGVGKSAVARMLFETRSAAGERTVWLDAMSFEHPDFNAFQASLGLIYPLQELFAAEQGAKSVLVVDGLDRLYADNAFRIAARLLRLTRQPAPAAQWRIVVPCQVQEWPRVLEALLRAGLVETDWAHVEVPPLSTDDLAPVRAGFPALEKLFLQRRVGGLLGNLKILDLVARHVVADDTVDAAAWVGESSVADWFWLSEVERGSNRLARGAVARRLAQTQADRLLAAVPIDDFASGELAPIESLTADRVCVQLTGDRLAFGHDLFGDWARLRLLVNHQADLQSFLRERSASPLWHRAIRLLGVRLLEQAGIDEWRRVLATFGSQEPGSVYDLLLEAPVFATNAAEALEAIRADLMASDGALLRRLLTRFLAFATIPDAEKLALARAIKVDASIARAKYRVPYWPYWLEVLSFLHEHRAEAFAAAPAEIARIVQMWLAFAPSGGRLRREVSEIGILIGREAVARREDYRGRDWEEDRQRFYRCALAAAQEFPEEVAQIALTACERITGPESPGGNSSKPTARPARRGGLFPPPTPVEPWPDGPRDWVDDAFQTVVLDSGAIFDLFRVRPQVAREVVLATLIEPPAENGWAPGSFRGSDLDFVDRMGWHPGFYTQGPFLGFLNISFSEGLPLILRLIDFATSRWRDHAVRDLEEQAAQALAGGQPEATVEEALRRNMPHDLTITVGSDSRSFLGDERVYGWSAGLGNPPKAVQASLMALEQYLYMRLDEKEDVAAMAEAVLARATNVAILAVLCDVGKRHPVLFEGPLRVLLAAPELYAWEITKRCHGRSHLIIGASDQGEWFMKLAQTFHNLPHRKADLRRVATFLLIHSSVMREYLASVVATWRSLEAAALPKRVGDMREQMILTLDFGNYEARDDPEHGRGWINVALERLQVERASERGAMEEHALLQGFPMRCRKILDEHQVLADAELDEMWRKWAKIREMEATGKSPIDPREQFGDEFANAIAGGAAVFLSQPVLWGADTARRDEAQQALLGVLEKPPSTRAFDSADSVSDWSWDCFGAEALAVLWAREPANAEWRTGVAQMVFAPHYNAVKLLFARCSEHRKALGADFSRLRRLALEWAFVHDRVVLLRHVPREALQIDDEAFERIGKNLDAWQKERIQAFVSGTLGKMPADWTECDERARFVELDPFRARWHREDAMDFHLVRSAHEWGPFPSQALDDDERRDWLQFWCSALSTVIRRPMADDSRRYPDDNELWVLYGIGAVLLQLRPEEHAEKLWEPIIDLTGDAHNWPEVFLRAFHGAALRTAPTPASYVPLVRQMVERAFTDIDDGPRWRSFEEVWEALLAMDSRSQRHWEARHLAVVTALAEVIEFWYAHVPPDDRRLRNVAYWLSQPAAAPVRLRSLSWFDGVLRSTSTERLRDSELDEVADALAGLLNVVWHDSQQELRCDDQGFGTFRDLLAWLVDQQNERGLELAGRIGGFA